MLAMRRLRFANLRYYILMHAIVLAFGFTGILGKLIQLDFFQIVFHRMWIASVSLLLFLVFSGRKFAIRNPKVLLKVLGVGAVVLLHWLTFFKAIQVSTASIAVLCMATTALHVSWLEPLVMRRKFSKLEFFLGLAVIGGVIAGTNNLDATQLTGMLWGLFSALLSAFFVVFNAYLNQVEKLSSSSITLYEMLGGSAMLLIGLSLSGKVEASFFKMNWADFGWLLFLGVVCTSLAFLLMIDIIEKIGAYTATLSINLEPVYSILLAVPILAENEILGTNFYLGSLFIIAIVFANPILQNQRLKNQRRRRLKELQRLRRPFT